jgi:hypothetical protein
MTRPSANESETPRVLIENSLRVVIPSRAREQILVDNALKLFPYATVTVAESEMASYARYVNRDQLVAHPDKVTGIAPIRQWILDNFDDEAILMADDDVYKVVSLVAIVPVPLKRPGDIAQLVENAATCAKAAGSPVFGFDQSFDVRKFNPLKPFSFNAWSGGVIGFIGRELRYDTNLRLRADIDFCMQALLKKRITYQDCRISFKHKRFGLIGGNAINRSEDRNRQEIEYLKRKWGRFLTIKAAKSTTRIIMNVPREQENIKLANE